jgi:hypothetical protein
MATVYFIGASDKGPFGRYIYEAIRGCADGQFIDDMLAGRNHCTGDRPHLERALVKGTGGEAEPLDEEDNFSSMKPR